MDIHEEDYKVLIFILDTLIERADKSLEKFSSNFDNDYEDLDRDDDEEFPYKGKVKCWSIHYNGDLQQTTFKFTPIYKTVSISIGYDVSREFNIGFGHQNKDIKIKIMRLFKKIAAWELVEIPRRAREKFINDVVKTFPNLFDHLILGDEDGKEEDS